jgi:transcriptional regulator with XRE-family HTH domain
MREAMKATGKRQVDLVRETGIDKGSISNYLYGRYEPKQEAVYKLALALNVDEMWLWGYDVPSERKAEEKIPEEKEKPTVIDDGLSDDLRELIMHLKTLPEDKIQMLLQVAKSIK